MSVDLNALCAGTRAVMTADATLTALVPASRIVDAHALRVGTAQQAGTTVPCIGVNGPDVAPVHFQQGKISALDAGFGIETWSYSADALRSIVARIMELFDGGSVSVAGYRTYPATVDPGQGHMFDERTGLHRWIVTVSYYAIVA